MNKINHKKKKLCKNYFLLNYQLFFLFAGALRFLTSPGANALLKVSIT